MSNVGLVDEIDEGLAPVSLNLRVISAAGRAAPLLDGPGPTDPFTW